MSKQMQLPDIQAGTRKHPGAGLLQGRYHTKGRKVDPQALNDVQKILGTWPRERRRMVSYLHAIQDEYGYLSARHLTALAHEINLSQAQVYEVATFYSQFILVGDDDAVPPQEVVRICDGLTCELAGAKQLLKDCEQKFDRDVMVVKSSCMGRCDHAPVASINKRHVDHASADELDKVLQSQDFNPIIPAYKSFEEYIADGGYELLKSCLSGEYERETIIDIITESNLRGFGGAGYLAGRKWRSVFELPKPKVLVVNFDESEMGTFKDRYFTEQDPHRLLEGILVAAWTCEAYQTYIYLRDEYHYIRRILEDEIARLDDADLTHHCQIFLIRGAGAYICGERSAMLESIEGRRGYPRLKDPRTSIVGLFGIPTLINNAETLFWVRDIVQKGPEWFRNQGRNDRLCPRSFSVSGRINKPGVKLAAAGITMNQLIMEYCGGIQEGHTFKGYTVGGSSGGILPASMADIPLDFGTLEEYGCSIGSAAIIVFSDKDPIHDVVLNLLRFLEEESCGQCTPCRVGTEKAVKLLEQPQWDEELLNDLCMVMEDASICGLGKSAPNPIRSALRYFRDELNLG